MPIILALYNACVEHAALGLHDDSGRRYRKLRLSVTDRCQLRCRYCMPQGPVGGWLPRADILAYEQLAAFAAIVAPLGVRDVRLTGGEPLLRRGLTRLLALLRDIPEIERVTLTTNGILLPQQLAELTAAGLDGVTVSIDSLCPRAFAQLSGGAELAPVLAGVEALAASTIRERKLNAVVVRGINDNELPDLVRFAAARGMEMRFIEWMPFGAMWRAADVVRADEMVARVAAVLGPLTPIPVPQGSTAQRWRLGDGTCFGVIPTLSGPLCGDCDRLRLSADGRFHNCLFDAAGVDVSAALRAGDATTVLATVRAHLLRKGPGYVAAQLKGSGGFVPLEHMHQVGG